MEELTAKGKEKATDDAFFLERLEMLYEQNLADMRAFAEREGKPFDEVCGRAGGQCMYFLSAVAVGQKTHGRATLEITVRPFQPSNGCFKQEGT